MLDRQGESTTHREATPQAPEKTPGSIDGTKPGQKDPGTPRGNQSSTQPARNASAGAPPKSGGDEARGRGSDVDKWGDLPVHVRDVFRAQGGGDMPAAYRDWIDAYYRRMAKRSGS